MSATWQPIETAPKDGTPILVWAKGSWSIAHLSRVRSSGEWIAMAAGDEAIRHQYENGDEDYVVVVPTHWMPLPDPPSEGQADVPPSPKGEHT